MPVASINSPLLAASDAARPTANTGYDGARVTSTRRSANRSSGGSPTSCTSPGHLGSTPAAPSTSTASPVRANRGRSPAATSNSGALAYHRPVDSLPPEQEPTADREPDH